MAGNLSALKIRNAQEGMHLDGDGLYLQVKGNSKTWIFKYRNRHFSTKGKPLIREMGLGPFPLFSLVEARERRDEQRKLLVDGIDPIEHRRAKTAEVTIEKMKAVTFKECAEQYIETHRHAWKNQKHIGQWSSSLTTFVYPIIGDLPVASIDIALVLKVLQQRVGETTFWLGKTETASRVRGRIELVLGWAKAQNLRSGDNPASWNGAVKHLLPAKSQVAPVEAHAALPYVEVAAFMAELRANKSLAARALEWTVLCAVRTGDTTGATWSEIDRKSRTWTIPAARLKGKKNRKNGLKVPLSDRALEILNGLPIGGATSLIFPLTEREMRDLLRDMRPSEGLTVHGFRSTFKDWVSEKTDYQGEMSEIALSHTVSDKVEAAYRRGDMLEKRARMMADWASYCASTPVETGDKVVALRT